MENTGQWLFESDDFIDWVKKSESSVFWLNGDRRFSQNTSGDSRTCSDFVTNSVVHFEAGVGKSHLT